MNAALAFVMVFTTARTIVPGIESPGGPYGATKSGAATKQVSIKLFGDAQTGGKSSADCKLPVGLKLDDKVNVADLW